MRHETFDFAASRMVVLPHIDPLRGRSEMTVAAETYVSDMVALAFPGLPNSALDRVRVTIGEHVVAREAWRHVRPKPGTTVVVRLIPGNDTLRNALSVAVLVGAIALGQFYAPTLAGALLPTSLTGYGTVAATASTLSLAGSLATAGFAVAGTLLLNALVPARGLGDKDKDTDVYAITGLQNSANPGGVIPSILGQHRYAPPYAATPYTQIIGDDQYVIAAFLFGHGPLSLSNHRLGDTPTSEYSDIEMEIREGYDGEDPITLYPHTVVEDQLSVELVYNVAVERFTARDADSCSIDFAFVQGLVRYDDKGKPQYQTSTVRIRYRLVGAADYIEQATLNMDGNEQKLIRRTYSFGFPTRGQYQIELKRLSPDSDDTKVMDRVDLVALRITRPESPFNFSKPVSIVALRIRASNQLNGIVNNYNADAELICPDWDSDTQTWITRATRNPASLFRWVLQGPANAYPKTDDQIDLAKLQDWHEFCASKDLKYDRVHDYDSSRLDVLADIAAAGRATPRDDGMKWSVTIDRPQTTYVSAISPRNSWDFQGVTPQVKFPDGHRVQFIDATNEYSQAERIVPFPGVNPADVQVTEDLSLPGKTDPNEIWRETRRRQYELIYRPHTYTVSQDVESLVLSRGDLAPLNHDVLDRDHVSARITSVSGSRIILDTSVTMEAGRNYAVTIRLADSTSIRRSVVTVAGETSALLLIGDAPGVAAGDLALFGTSIGNSAFDVIVKNVERGDNLTAKLTLIDAAPIIDDLTDAEVPPPWDGRVGEEIDISALLPAVPNVSISDSALTFYVALTPGSGSVALPSTYVVSYRIHGSGPFSTVTADASAGSVPITGFLVGDVIDVKARAVSAYGQSSADSAIQQATLHAAEVNSPSLDSDTATMDATIYTMDHF